MKQLHALLLSLLASTTSAQLLTSGTGSLPTCGQTCTTLVNAQTSCNGASASSTDLQAWTCFCQTVWAQSGGQLTTMCATTCSNPSDETLISQWYTANCGSDNGRSEHGGSTGTTNGAAPAGSSSAASNLPSTSAVAGTGFDSGDVQTCSGWWGCHWKWVVMIIVIAIGLLILGFGGRWLKKRHDRKQDRLSGNFNAGITTRNSNQPHPTVPPMSSHDAANTATYSNVYNNGAADPNDPSGGRNSPVRTRDAFMPYGYGYTRSESRLGSNNSPLARGTTPVGELEKAEGSRGETPESAPRKKSRRIMVREKSMGAES